ncbi:hypothetical protein [Rhodophyticola porphyridii]|uniref:hypothetical protein n=1 Tax=Rhodophyticola porphyridii TaxID=1852017 RepID=UPI0035D05C68
MSDEEKPKSPGKSDLADSSIKTSRGLNRRRLLRGMGLGTIGLGLSGCVATPTTVGGGVTDADNGPITDPGGRGRGGLRSSRTGITDADNGPITDPGGFGRGGGGFTQVRSGITDRDTGAFADPVGNGRDTRRTGLTDSDLGMNADPAGFGRRGF